MPENKDQKLKSDNSPRILVWSARVFLVLVVLLLFNVNFDAFRAGAANPISGQGTPKYLAKWVDPGAFDYNLSNSGNITVTQGSSASNIITATLISGVPQSIDLWRSAPASLPAGATESFEPSNSVTPSGSRTYFIFTAPTTPTGTYTITISGSVLSGKTTTFDLIVNPAAVGAECDDGINNDTEDGLIDYPADPGCTDPADTDESNACSDGIDNDGDSLVDYNPTGGGDPGCLSTADNDERNNPTFEEVQP